MSDNIYVIEYFDPYRCEKEICGIFDNSSDAINNANLFLKYRSREYSCAIYRCIKNELGSCKLIFTTHGDEKIKNP
jgi:hypothetical protein